MFKFWRATEAKPHKKSSSVSFSLLQFSPHKQCLDSLQLSYVIFLNPSDLSSYCDCFITDRLSLSVVLRSAHRIWLCTLSTRMGQWGSTADLQQQLRSVSTRWDSSLSDWCLNINCVKTFCARCLVLEQWNIRKVENSDSEQTFLWVPWNSAIF